MTLLVGLGNPDSKYKKNRHNVGFMLIDKFKEKLQTSDISKPQFRGELLKYKDLLLLKPLTFMNLSGASVRAVCDYYKPDRVIVIHDDLDLPFGSLKFKFGGGHGGHNGLRSIDENITNEYLRVRVGIGKPKERSKVSNYVLSDFTKEEFSKLESILNVAIDAIKEFLNGSSLNSISSKYTLKGK